MSPTPEVAVVMGSRSDWPVMENAVAVLDDFDIGHEARVLSAHRMPVELHEFGASAADRGLKIIIAGAGGAAHLPGMLAAMTELPVLGVPVAHQASMLRGVDALLSIVQMPRGVPVATVAIHNAANAGLLAVRTLGAAERSALRRQREFFFVVITLFWPTRRCAARWRPTWSRRRRRCSARQTSSRRAVSAPTSMARRGAAGRGRQRRTGGSYIGTAPGRCCARQLPPGGWDMGAGSWGGPDKAMRARGGRLDLYRLAAGGVRSLYA